MKKYIMLLWIGASALGVSAQGGASVPSKVQVAFAKAYPGVQKVKWGKEGNNYEAEFMYSGVERSTVWDANGRKLEVEDEITPTQLPAPALAYMQARHPGEQVTEAARIELANGTVRYEIETPNRELLFDQEGRFVETVKQGGGAGSGSGDADDGNGKKGSGDKGSDEDGNGKKGSGDKGSDEDGNGKKGSGDKGSDEDARGKE